MTTRDADLSAPSRGRDALIVSALVFAGMMALLLLRDRQLPTSDFALPMWLVLVVTFNLMTLVVLVAQYRGGAGPRVLAFTWALVWSAVLAAGTLLALPAIFHLDDGLQHSGNAVAWLWAARHLGVPALIVVSIVPWSEAFSARLSSPDHRTRRVLASHALVLVPGAALVWVVAYRPRWLPLLDHVGNGRGLPATWLLAIVMLANLLLLLAGLLGVLSRRRVQGLESWALVALVADTGDTVLTFATHDNHSVGWYGARTLGLLGAIVVLSALLRETNLAQARTRQYAAQLAEQNASLTEAQGLRDHLVAVVSHDMRSPLAGLQGYLEVLEEDDDLTPAEIRRMHARSRLLTRRLILLTEDLLASATTNGLQVIPEPVNLRRQFEDCIAAFPELTVIIHCPPDLEVMADPLRLQQILVNLVRNAQKYGAEPVRLHGTRIAGSTAQISVSDAGRGVDPEFVPRLFDRYSRGNDKTTHGSGLGLSVARSLAERHGGSIGYEASTNAFVVRLPAVHQRTKAGLSLARKALTPSAKSGPV